MKKVAYLIVIILIFVTGCNGNIFAQNKSENTWLMGTWVGEDAAGQKMEIVLNSNGTGKYSYFNGKKVFDIIFSINENKIYLFENTGYKGIDTLTIYRITDQRIVVSATDLFGLYNLNKNK